MSLNNIEKGDLSSLDKDWETILRNFFWDFLEFFLPTVYEAVNTRVIPEFDSLDFLENSNKEKRPCFLVKINTKEGKKLNIFICIEIKPSNDMELSERMFKYYCAILNQYNLPVVCISILTDNNENFHPSWYEVNICGKKYLEFDYERAKLIDLYHTEEEQKKLLKNKNPFALIVLACIKAHISDSLERKSIKAGIINNLLRRDYSEKQITLILKFIDRMIILPEKYEKAYMNELQIFVDGENTIGILQDYEKEKYQGSQTGLSNGSDKKKYQEGRQKGRFEGRILELKHRINQVLSDRFGNISHNTKCDISDIRDYNLLGKIFERAIRVVDLESFETYMENLHKY